MFRALALWVLFVWSFSILIMYIYSDNRQMSNWDDKLQSIAIKLLQMMPANLEADASVFTTTLKLRSDVAAKNHELTFQVWSGGKRLLASTPGGPQTPLRADFGDGFANVIVGDQDWRVYSVTDESGRYQVQVGNDRSMIDADFQKHSARAVSLAAFGMALVGLMMWWSVRRTLRPIATMEQATRNRSKFDLTPLPTEALPSELLPLVDSFNYVLKHLDQSINAERQFISDAAHELRTPLAALQAQLEVTLSARTEQERTQSLRKVLDGVKRSSRLSEQLLDMARLEAGNRAPLRNWQDLKDIVSHVAGEFEVSAARQQKHIELEMESCPVHCDVDEMGILVRNLVDNALRYTDHGGRVRISCGYRDDAEKRIPFLEVADDGPGVPTEEREAIFERFYRVSTYGTVRGAGIGLSLVLRIARMHGARIQTFDGIGNPGLSVRLLFPPAREMSE
jgi:signal transduction histidine kinase